MTTCRESQERYLALAREVRDVDLKYLFSSYALQRGKFLAELEIWGSGGWDGGIGNGEPEPAALAEAGEVSAARRDEREVLWECLEREEEVLRVYGEADDPDAPEELRALLAGQVRDVKAARARLRELQLLSEDTG